MDERARVNNGTGTSKSGCTQTKGASTSDRTSVSESRYDTNRDASERTNEGRARTDEKARANNGTGTSGSGCTHKQKGPA